MTAEHACPGGRSRCPPRRRGLTALLGVPLAIKDVLSTEHQRRPAAARSGGLPSRPSPPPSWRGWRPQAWMMLGKTNTDEFAMGSSTENSAYQTTANPWDPSRVPGGSSGGSAAAVAADEALGALGSDTGGSVRQPASLCGVVGLKPSYGRVSRYGLVAYGSSLDQVGPITKTWPTQRCCSPSSPADDHDSTSWPGDVPDYVQALTGDVTGLRVGVPAEYFIDGMEPAVEAAVRAAIAQLAALGAEIVPISLPNTDKALPSYYMIATAEASANLSRYDGDSLRLRIAAPTACSENYRQARPGLSGRK
ncbi:MAG: amidase family protein [Caldilineaceae bacterium]